MELTNVIKERRSIRKFKKEDISKEIVEDVINCGRLAPSAKNRQPWYFVILKKDMKNKVADLMFDYAKQETTHSISGVKATAKIVKEAPILILIFKQKDNDWIISDNLSVGACVENMCLRATDLGLGSLWIRDTVYVENEITNIFGPKDMELNCALVLGYSNSSPKQKSRKELIKIVKWYD